MEEETRWHEAIQRRAVSGSESCCGSSQHSKHTKSGGKAPLEWEEALAPVIDAGDVAAEGTYVAAVAEDTIAGPHCTGLQTKASRDNSTSRPSLPYVKLDRQSI